VKRISQTLLATLALAGLPASAFAQEAGGTAPRQPRVEGEAFTAPTSDAAGTVPAETEAPNTTYKPMLPNQTRAPKPAEATKVKVETVAKGIDSPWAL